MRSIQHHRIYHSTSAVNSVRYVFQERVFYNNKILQINMDYGIQSFDSCKLIPMRVYTLQYFMQSTNVQICYTRAGAWFKLVVEFTGTGG